MSITRLHNWQVIYTAISAMRPGDVITDEQVLDLLPGSTMTSALVAFRQAARACEGVSLAFVRIRHVGFRAATVCAEPLQREYSHADLIDERFGPIPWDERSRQPLPLVRAVRRRSRVLSATGA